MVAPAETRHHRAVPATPLNAVDYDPIDRAASELRRRGWQISPSINSAINGWASFVLAVESGYDESVYEYTNDMSIRTWIGEARPFLTAAVVEALDAQLAPWDERFKAATAEARRPPGRGTHWWEKRLPRTLVGELAEDAKVLGLV